MTHNFDKSDDEFSDEGSGVLWSRGVKEVKGYLNNVLQTIAAGAIPPVRKYVAQDKCGHMTVKLHV